MQIPMKLQWQSAVRLTSKGKTDCEDLQEDLKKLSDWETVWQMKLSVGKYKVIHIETKQIPTSNMGWWGLNLLRLRDEKILELCWIIQ